MFNVKYLAMHTHTGAISKLLYGFACIWTIKIVDYLPVHTHKPYTNLQILSQYIYQIWKVKLYNLLTISMSAILEFK